MKWKEELNYILTNNLYVDVFKKVEDLVENLLEEQRKELEASIRKEVLLEALEHVGYWDYDTIMNSTVYNLFKEYVEFKGITLK